MDGAWRMDVEVEVGIDKNAISCAWRFNAEEVIASESEESDISEESEPETSNSESECE